MVAPMFGVILIWATAMVIVHLNANHARGE
jgi:hypothetical protein